VDAAAAGAAGALLGLGAGIVAEGRAVGVASTLAPVLTTWPVRLAGLGVAVPVAADCERAGCTGAWLLAAWMGAVRTNRIAKPAAARGLTWGARQGRRGGGGGAGAR